MKTTWESYTTYTKWGLTMNDPNVLIMVYLSGKEIITIKDEFEKLEPKIAALEKMGIKVTLIPASREKEIEQIMFKHGATKQLPN